MDSIIYKELGALTKSKERWEENIPYVASLLTYRIEKKYDTYLSVFQEDGFKGYYYMAPMRNKRLSVKKSEQYYPTFNEAMRALILNIKVITE